MKQEEAFQRCVAVLLDSVLPATAAWSAIGHGGGGKIRGAMLKGMGVKAGVPDLFVCHNSKTLFIELKSDKGRVSPEQAEFHQRLMAAGIMVRVCRTTDHVMHALIDADIPLRGRIAA